MLLPVILTLIGAGLAIVATQVVMVPRPSWLVVAGVALAGLGLLLAVVRLVRRSPG